MLKSRFKINKVSRHRSCSNALGTTYGLYDLLGILVTVRRQAIGSASRYAKQRLTSRPTRTGLPLSKLGPCHKDCQFILLSDVVHALTFGGIRVYGEVSRRKNRERERPGGCYSIYLPINAMDSLTEQASTVRFGVFEADLRTGELRKNG